MDRRIPTSHAAPRPRIGPKGLRGSVLPMAILALVVLGLLGTVGIQLVLRGPPGSLPAQRATGAFYVAESGMNMVLANWRPRRDLRVWGASDVWTGDTGEGNWEAEIRRVGDRLYFIRSTGRLMERGGGTSAQRSVGMVARLETPRIDPLAALRTSGPVTAIAPARIIGSDTVPAGWSDLCPEPEEDVPAVSSTEGMVGVPPGLPPGGFRGFEEATWSELTALASLELPGGIIDDLGPTAVDSVCDTSRPTNWGDPDHPDGPCGGYFPMIHLSGDVTIRASGAGQGVLLAGGDLRFEGDFTFFGLVIARGAIHLLGGERDGPSVLGGVAAENPRHRPQRFEGNAMLRNSRCAVRRALIANESLTRLHPLAQLGWVDLSSASL